jgi:rsbT co-antagonist protein RsbR
MSESLNVDVLKRILERLPGVAFCCRTDPVTKQSGWVYVDSRMAEIFDLPGDELASTPSLLGERLLPEDRDRLRGVVERSLETGASLEYQGRVRRRNGEIRWLEVHITGERDADGSVVWYGQVADVTARKALEQALADSEAAKAKSESLYRQVIDALPVGVLVASLSRQILITNPVVAGLIPDPVADDSDMARAYGAFKTDGVTPFPMEEGGMARALRGESPEVEWILRNPHLDGDQRIHAVWRPLRDEHGAVTGALGALQNVTVERRLAAELRARNEELAHSEAAKAELIARLRHSIDELSNPILEVWDDVLVMPIIGVIDSRRTADMVQRLLAEVTRSRARFVIIDLTGVEVVDTKTADHLMKLKRKVEVVGARCVLTGIRAAVAATLVDIGVDFGQMITLRNLKHGLREALRHGRREGDVATDLEPEDDPSAEPTSPRRAR